MKRLAESLLVFKGSYYKTEFVLSQYELVLNQIGCELFRFYLNFKLVEPFYEHILMRFENGLRYERVDSELLDDLEQINFCVQFGAPLDKQLVIYGLVIFAAFATVFLTAATTQNREASPVVHHIVLEWFAAQQVVL